MKQNITDIQEIAKKTMSYLQSKIKVGMTLKEIAQVAEDKMLQLGADGFWYYGIGCLIYSGVDTTKSVSGRKYNVADNIVQQNDIITIDLSPKSKKLWGDYARTFIVQDGIVLESIHDIKNSEWKTCMVFEEILHEKLLDFVNEKTTFELLYFFINDFITKNGFVNLDFAGNLGHSIERRMQKRKYIEKGNKKLINSVDFFTFEPHIGIIGGKYGVKLENIYSFNNGKLVRV